MSSDAQSLKKATFAGGCFWCMEPPYDKLDGVVSTISGYIGGKKDNPTYKDFLSQNQTQKSYPYQVSDKDQLLQEQKSR